jgi:hypothetical protein
MEKVPALLLTLGGAPSTWHALQGLPGFYHPDIPSPVGGPGEAPLEAAQELARAPGAPVKLVKITPKQAELAREEIARQRKDARGHVLAARQQGLPVPAAVLGATAQAAGITSAR